MTTETSPRRGRIYRKADSRFSEKTPGGIRDKNLTIRLTAEELDHIRRVQSATGMSVANLISAGLESLELIKELLLLFKKEGKIPSLSEAQGAELFSALHVILGES